MRERKKICICFPFMGDSIGGSHLSALELIKRLDNFYFYPLNYEEIDYFISTMEKIFEKGASILGGCCGSSPEHIARLFELRNKICLSSKT